ncbi:MAG: hemolysin family protein [Actinomycetes bacterium]
MIWVNVLVVFALLLVEALFVASEMALVTLREGQVRALAERGKRGRRLQHLVDNPNRFLSAVQIGVTLAALGSSAFGEVTLAKSATDGLHNAGLTHWAASLLGFVGVFLVITYATLVIGELAPKRLALQRAEGTAWRVGGLIDRFAGLMRPVIWFLSKSTDAVVRLVGGDPSVGRESISEAELRDLVAAHESLTTDERKLIDEVFDAGERPLREVMVPRTEVEFLDASMTLARAAKIAATSTHSRFPVVRGSHDEVVGFVHVRDLITSSGTTRRTTVKVSEVAREVTLLPDTKRVLPTLSELRRSGQHIAVVVDEYGGTAGIVTLEDLIEELIGEIRDEYDAEDPDARRLRGGDLDVDGLLSLDDFADETGIELPEGPYETVAGYVMSVLGRLPRLGDVVEGGGNADGSADRVARFRVTEVDGRRVARLQVSLPTTDVDGASDDEQVEPAPAASG